MNVNVPHFLDVDDLSSSELREVLERARDWKASPGDVPPLLEHRSVAAVYQKPSVRTRVSFEVAVHTLGGHCVSLQGEEVGVGTRESPADVARTLASFCSVIGARVFDHRMLEEMARAAGVPVLNLLSDRAHPGQAVGDLLTLEERLGPPLEGRRLAFVGDGNNVAGSLAVAAALTGLEMVVASPPGYELDDAVVERARNLGGVVELVSDPYDAVAGADAVYTDVWASMGQEDEAAARRAAFAPYQVGAPLLAAAQPDAVFLHCLPAHRGEEVTDEVIEGPSSAVWQQVENRMHSYRALVAHLLGGKTAP
ncbi:MAG: ornithine carbamoyltransferase [Acidimicrobiia bacterium]